MKETAYEHVAGTDHFTVTAAERWSVGMIRRLAEKHPDEVKIIYENEDGSILAHVPLEWMRIRPKKKRVLTEEQRQVLSERMRRIRSEQTSGDGTDSATDDEAEESEEALAAELLMEGDDGEDDTDASDDPMEDDDEIF